MKCNNCNSENIEIVNIFPLKFTIFDNDLFSFEINKDELEYLIIERKINDKVDLLIQMILNDNYNIKNQINCSNSTIEIKINYRCNSCKYIWTNFNLRLCANYNLLNKIDEKYNNIIISSASKILDLDCNYIIDNYNFIEWRSVYLEMFIEIIKENDSKTYESIKRISNAIDKIILDGEKGGGGGFPFDFQTFVIYPLIVGYITNFIYDLSKLGVKKALKIFTNTKNKKKLILKQLDDLETTIKNEYSSTENYNLIRIFNKMSKKDRKKIINQIGINALKLIEDDIVKMMKKNKKHGR
jgi:hypothetical protein